MRAPTKVRNARCSGPALASGGTTRGRPGPPSRTLYVVRTADLAAADESALETRTDALCGRCGRCRGDLERPAPGPGTGASGRTLGGRWRDHLATCQGSKMATRRQIKGISGQGEAGSGSGGGSSVDRTPIFTPMRRPWHPSSGQSEGPATRGVRRRTNSCQPAHRMSTPAAVRLTHDPCTVP